MKVDKLVLDTLSFIYLLGLPMGIMSRWLDMRVCYSEEEAWFYPSVGVINLEMMMKATDWPALA